MKVYNSKMKGNENQKKPKRKKEMNVHKAKMKGNESKKRPKRKE